jgi:glycosyltransferase involved in cell wall biosynthesis
MHYRKLVDHFKPLEVEPSVDLPLWGQRILLIVQNEPVPFDRRVWQEALALHSAGATVRVISPIGRGYETSYEVIDGIHVYRHPFPFEAKGLFGYFAEYGNSLFWQLLLAAQLFFRHGFDVIHASNPPDLIVLVAMLFKPVGVKFVFDHHDLSPELYEAKFARQDLFWRWLLMMEKLSFKIADIAIATNNSYRRIAIDRGRMTPRNVFVVRNGPDLTRLRTVPSNPAWKRGRSYLVGYVGVISELEGIDLLLRSVSYITQTIGRKDIQFCIVGGGTALSHYIAKAERQGLLEFVTFTGRVSDATLVEVLSTADICVNPDRVTQFTSKSTMTKILEYMALGKPIVQFDVIEGRYSSQKASLYAKPNDANDFAHKILKLLDDTGLRSTLGQVGRARIASELSWDLQVPNLIAAYKHLLLRNPSSRRALT